MNSKSIFLFSIFVLFLFTVTAVYAEDIKVGNLNFEIPDEFTGGDNHNVNLGRDVYTKSVEDNFFRIFVYRDTEHIDTYVGYMIDNADTAEYLSVNGRPVLFLTMKKPLHKSVLIFESDSELVTVEVPNSDNLTDTERGIVNSAPKSTLSGKDFDKLMLQAVNQYESANDLEASSGYYSGYSDGSRSGYSSGYHRGSTRGLIAGYILGRI